MKLFPSHPTIDALFDEWKPALGRDFTAYRNHAYRVFNLACALSGAGQEAREQLAVAAAFHDIAIWLDDTFDYLEPSIQRATRFLEETGRPPRSHHVFEPNEILIEDVAIEKQDRGKRLVLRGGGDLSIDRQVGEVGLDLALSHVTRMAFPVEKHEALDPGDVGLFRPVAQMTGPHGLPYLVQQVRSPRCG